VEALRVGRVGRVKLTQNRKEEIMSKPERKRIRKTNGKKPTFRRWETKPIDDPETDYVSRGDPSAYSRRRKRP
jgi:hypothetical protein